MLPGADMTDTRRARAAHHQLAAIVAGSTDFVGLATSAGRVTFINATGRRLLGLDETATLPRQTADYVFPDDVRVFEGRVLPTLDRDGHWEGELRFLHFPTARPT